MSKRDAVEICLILWVTILWWVLSTIGIAKLLGAQPRRIGIGVGPTLRKLVVRGVEVTLALPVPSAYVSYVGSGNWPESEPGGFRLLPLWRRLAVTLGPNLLGLLMGVACLGVHRAALSALHAPAQVLLEPERALSGFMPVFLHGSRVVTLGVLFVKLSCWNLLPIPPLATWQALLELRPLSARLPGTATQAELNANLVGLTVLLLLSLRWVRAGIRLFGPG